MLNTNLKFTYEDYVHMPEGKRYEIVEGELYMVPAPTTTHQRISRKLEEMLSRFVEERKLGEVFYAPIDVVFSETDIVQPDIIFISNENKNIIKEENIKGAPDLIIEILSPSGAQRDKIIKKKLYARNGVKEYWLAEPQKKTIEALVLEKRGYETFKVFSDKEVLTSRLIKGLQIPVENIF